jgi:hypothetical protein
MDLFIRSPIRLHGVVLNSLSIGTTSPFLLGLVFGNDITARIFLVLAQMLQAFERARRWEQKNRQEMLVVSVADRNDSRSYPAAGFRVTWQ